ncbi:MAG TPA: hypothetical protein VH560_09680 [Polyangia bacterium]|nr:hypothetical protein [Polyangia bacterium]
MNSKSPRFRHVVVSSSLALTFAYVLAGGACGGGGSGGSAGHAGGTAGALGTAGAQATAGAQGTAGAGTAGTLGTAGAQATAGAQGTAGAAAANTPEGQCDQFVTTFCKRLNECEPSDGGTDSSCEALFQVGFRCAGATSTAFPTCISDVAGLSCAGLFDPTNGFQAPASCTTPLDIPITDAQNKCLDLVDVLCDPTEICNNVTPTDVTDFESCEDEGVQDLGCLFVTGESTTYPTCIRDLCSTSADAGTDPDAGVTTPLSCNNVLTFPPGTTGTTTP